MGQITTGVRRLLSAPIVYTAFQNLMGASEGWVRLVDEFVRPFDGMTILDLGCGPGDLLRYLPDGVMYWGFDISEPYIAHAKAKYGTRGNFVCKVMTSEDLVCLPKFDVVMASGVLHHLDDSSAQGFIRLAHDALAPGGRLITVDPCWDDGQSAIAKLLISLDRGQNVRDRRGYEDLAETVFADRKVLVRHKSWIPYTHCFMECVSR